MLIRRCSSSRRGGSPRAGVRRQRCAAQFANSGRARRCQMWPMADAISASLAPPRSSARRSWPCVANRHRYSLPSVDRRARLQSPQNACVTLLMTPISPPPSRVAPSAAPSRRARGGSSGTSGNSAAMRRTHLGRGQHFVHAPAVGGADVHVFDEAQHDAACRGSGAPSAGSRASLVPRLTTMLTLIGPRPAALRGVDAVAARRRPGSRRRSCGGTPRRRGRRG